MTMASANMDHTDMELDTDPIAQDNQLYQQAVQDLEKEGIIYNMFQPCCGYFKGLGFTLILPLVFFTRVMKVALPQRLFAKLVVHQQAAGKTYTLHGHTNSLYHTLPCSSLTSHTHQSGPGTGSAAPPAGHGSAAVPAMATFSTSNTADIAVLLRSSVEEKITVIPDEDSFAVDVSECRGYAHVKFDMIDPKLDPCSVFEGVLETASAQKVNSITFAVHIVAPESKPKKISNSSLLRDSVLLHKKRKMEVTTLIHKPGKLAVNQGSGMLVRTARSSAMQPKKTVNITPAAALPTAAPPTAAMAAVLARQDKKGTALLSAAFRGYGSQVAMAAPTMHWQYAAQINSASATEEEGLTSKMARQCQIVHTDDTEMVPQQGDTKV